MKVSLKICAAAVLAFTVVACGPRMVVTPEAQAALAGLTPDQTRDVVLPDASASSVVAAFNAHCVKHRAKLAAVRSSVARAGYDLFSSRSDGTQAYFSGDGKPMVTIGPVPRTSAAKNFGFCSVMTRLKTARRTELERYASGIRGAEPVANSKPNRRKTWVRKPDEDQVYIVGRRTASNLGEVLYLGLGAKQ